MSFPRFNPSRGDDAAQGSLETPHSTATPRIPRTAEHGQQEDFEQYFRNTPLWTPATPQDHLSNNDVDDPRRTSDSSERTLYEQTEEEMQRSLQRVSLSSYQHPNEIASPSNVYTSGGPPRSSVKRRFGHKALDESDDFRDEDDGQLDYVSHQAPLHRGVVSNLLELSRVSHSNPKWGDYGSYPFRSGSLSETEPDIRPRLSRLYSLGGYDADDPRITGATRELLDDPADLERNVKDQMGLRTMSYKQRRKEAQKIKIRFFVTSLLNRQQFIMKLARTLMTFGAPSHRIESQLVAAARILEVDAEFIHLPNIFLLSFADPETCTSETHFIKCSGRLALGNLKMVHQIYRQVVHDEISAKRATDSLDALLNSKPIYPVWARCAIAFCLSALICPLAFGGSIIDMFIAGFGALVLSSLQLTIVVKSQLYANVFEVSVAIFISFLARALSSIHIELFCYTAISSAGIVCILPGYLILSSSLELASKNMLCGSVKMVYALIYTLFLGFGLQIGSDFYLLFNPSERHRLIFLSNSLSHTTTFSGTFVSDNSTRFPESQPLFGTFAFTNGTSLNQMHIIGGCHRLSEFPWYLQPFPFWSQFITVPAFSVLSSLGNLQPWRSWDLVVMVVISCISFAANKTANHFIFNRSDVVSAIGAFAVGLLGNVYSRRFGGTAFTAMVTGVLFLVPSGLSQAGGLTASDSGIDIGGAMIAVTIGITVGLFMSQALVYTFGTRKNAAIFSF
ncbi:hypothetical protein F5888DRAFT_1747292 [Russula emetica]|nr:hypothetical protein F5888DRAFT_1747292 [Russula emetica]